MVCVDDAYYGMFFDEACETESLFGAARQGVEQPPRRQGRRRARRRSSSGGCASASSPSASRTGPRRAYKALEDKTAGLIRAYVSNISQPRPVGGPEGAQRSRLPQAAGGEGGGPARRAPRSTAKECRKAEYADCWDVYPFNSGYFMCLRLKDADADAVRVRLLDDHGVGDDRARQDASCGSRSPASPRPRSRASSAPPRRRSARCAGSSPSSAGAFTRSRRPGGIPQGRSR